MTDISTEWIIFLVSIFGLLALDLGVFNRKAHVIKPKEALLQAAFFISAAVVFNIWIYISMGSTSGLEFTTGYLMELMLSVDNLFVIILILSSFCVPSKDQHKVLFWGILGALVFRLAFIVVGVTLVESFSFVLYIFGAFLIYTGIKMVVKKEKESVEPEHNPMVKFFRRFMHVTKNYEGDKFFVRRPNSKGTRKIMWATPLFIALIVVETTDIVFAVDSIPAILGITTTTFIVFSSNAFAILGLRSLYFSLSHIMSLFCYLKYALAGILSFVGAKMLLADYVHIPVLGSLAVIVAILVVAIIASIMKNKRTAKSKAAAEETCEPCAALKQLERSEAEEGEGSCAAEGAEVNGATCPSLKELRDTEEKYHKDE
ncbi:MAG TPA: TerC family protein [Methanomassiliicoccales archaeon]